MSVKHIKEYYNIMYSQYKEMEADIKDLEEAVSKNIVMPETLQSVIAQLDKLKENYQRINYIMFLLDMPNKPQKQPKYKSRLNSAMKEIPESAKLEAVRQENAKCLDRFKQSIDELNA